MSNEIKGKKNCGTTRRVDKKIYMSLIKKSILLHLLRFFMFDCCFIESRFCLCITERWKVCFHNNTNRVTVSLYPSSFLFNPAFQSGNFTPIKNVYVGLWLILIQKKKKNLIQGQTGLGWISTFRVCVGVYVLVFTFSILNVFLFFNKYLKLF